MNKEKLVQVLSELIDKGASVTVHLPQFDDECNPIQKEEALAFANQFKEATGLTFMKEKHHEGICSSITVGEGWEKFHGCFSHSPVEYMEEDVSLDGGVEDVG